MEIAKICEDMDIKQIMKQNQDAEYLLNIVIQIWHWVS